MLARTLNTYESGVKRIVFSVWSDLSPNWIQYKEALTSKHEAYAAVCNADYQLVDTNAKFVDLMFLKVQLAEQLLDDYDEVLYLDLDVVPITHKSFFDSFNMDNICLHYTWNPKWKIDQKRLMLAEEGITSNNKVANTGVFAMNKNARDTLRFSERRYNIEKSYPDYKPNNEVYMSYLIEKHNIEYNEIGMPWNFILDRNISTGSLAAHFIHCSNKDFSHPLLFQ